MGALEEAQRERRMRERDRQIEAEIKRKEAYVPPVQRVKQAAKTALSAGKKAYAVAKPAVISVAKAAEKVTRPPVRRRAPTRRAPARRAAPRRAAPRRAAPKRRKQKRDPWDLGIRI